MRSDNRQPDELRPIRIQRHFTGAAPGSVLIQAGRTTVLCTASIDATVPAWLVGKQQGWVTAEYSMLPGSTAPRKQRDRGPKVDGRTSEIQRLIGRSFRAVIDLAALGERTVTIDCDVLEADGGTRTLSVTGGMIALVDALRAVFPGAGKTGDCPDFRGHHAQHGRENGTVPFSAETGTFPVPWGIYHVTNRGQTTWYDFAAEIFRLAGMDVRVQPITTAEYGAAAPRPAYSVLDTSAYHRLGGPPMPNWQTALAEYFAERASLRTM